jgi:hypothetical protein
MQCVAYTIRLHMYLARKADIACVRKRMVGLGEAGSYVSKHRRHMELIVVPLGSPSQTHPKTSVRLSTVRFT